MLTWFVHAALFWSIDTCHCIRCSRLRIGSNRRLKNSFMSFSAVPSPVHARIGCGTFMSLLNRLLKYLFQQPVKDQLLTALSGAFFEMPQCAATQRVQRYQDGAWFPVSERRSPVRACFDRAARHAGCCPRACHPQRRFGNPPC